MRPAIVIPFCLVVLIWGATWFVIKDQLAAAPPAWSVAYRFVLAAAGMAAWALACGERLRLGWRAHRLALTIGLLQFGINFNLVYAAQLHLTSGLVAVMFALLIVPNALLGRLVLGAPLSRNFLIGSGVALAGIGLLLAHEAQTAPVAGAVWHGVGLTGLAILCVSAANITQALPAARAVPLFSLLALAMAYGALADVLFALATAGPPVLPADLRYWLGVGYLALLGSVVAFPIYFALIRRIGPGRAAYSSLLVPVVAMAISTVLEGYQWTALAVAGAALVLSGSLVALRGRHGGKAIG